MGNCAISTGEAVCLFNALVRILTPEIRPDFSGEIIRCRRSTDHHLTPRFGAPFFQQQAQDRKIMKILS